MKRLLPIAAILLTALSMSTGHAQTGRPAIDDPEATVVSDLIVRGPMRGPAWWRVSKGDSVVWILGMPATPTPRDLRWDQAAVKRRLNGARALLLPPEGSFIFNAGEAQRQPRGGKDGWGRIDVATRMPPAIGARFTAARQRMRRPARRYASPAPLLAFFRLNSDYRTANRLEYSASKGAWKAVRELARAERVPEAKPPKIAGRTFTFSDIALDRPLVVDCAQAMLTTVETPPQVYRTAAEGWARGDLAVAVSAPREAFGLCENRLLQQGYSRKAIAAQADAIEFALTRAGKSVAVVHLRTLLAKDGVLERLAGKGYEIVDPAGATAVD